MSESEQKKGGRVTFFKVLWVITAVAAVIVMSLYFVKMSRIYETDPEKEATNKIAEVVGRVETASEPEAAKKPLTLEGPEPVAEPDSVDKPMPVSKTEPEKETKNEAETKAEPADRPEQGTEAETGTESENVAGTEPADKPEQGTETETAAETEPEGKTEPAGEPLQTAEQEPAAISEPAKKPAKANFDDPRNVILSSGRTVDPTKPMVALSFDDGPCARTDKILECLKEHNARATFFMVGYQIEYYQEQVKHVYEAGCEIGNHTIAHNRLTKLSAEDQKAKIQENLELLQSIVPIENAIIRPPYGVFNDDTKAVAGMPMFNWSVDSQDWESLDGDKIFKQVKNTVQDGYIILMHDIYDSTVDGALKVIPWLVEQGYQVVTVSELFEARCTETEPGKLYRYAKTAEEYKKEHGLSD